MFNLSYVCSTAVPIMFNDFHIYIYIQLFIYGQRNLVRKIYSTNDINAEKIYHA